MIACLILLSALVIVGTILRLFHRSDKSDSVKETDRDVTASSHGPFCCGTHEVCEKSNIARLQPIEYYNDEELDRFAGTSADAYSDDDIAEFRDVLFTLLPDDIAGWGISLEQRGINLPSIVREEFIMLLNENNRRHASA